MASREGYDESWFEKTVNKNLHCPICMNVLKEPVQCVRNQHYFCRPCITRHLEQNSQTCPMCQEGLTQESLAQPPRLLTDLLSALKIRCDYFERGCTELIELEFLHRHVENCGYSPVLCGNDGCTKTINKQDIKRHETELCDFRVLKCQDCGKDILYKEKKTHGCELKKDITHIKIDLVEIKDELHKVENQMQCIQEEVMVEVKEMKNYLTQRAKFVEDMNYMKNVLEDLQQIKTRGDIFVLGGFHDEPPTSSSVETFSWADKAWVPLQSMEEKRIGATSFVYQRQMFVAGGWNGRYYVDTVKRMQLDQKSGVWLDFPSKLPFKTRGHSSVVYKDRLIFIGGGNKNESFVSDGIYEILLVPPYSTKLLCRMPQPRWYHGAELIDDKIVIAGGATTENFKDSVVSVLLYDIIKNNFKKMPPLPFPLCGMASVYWKGNVILLGGMDNKSRVLNTVVKYDVKTGEHEMLPSMKHKRDECAAVVTGNTIVVIGGHDGDEGIDFVEYFNCDRYGWEYLPPMKEKKSWTTAVVKHV